MNSPLRSLMEHPYLLIINQLWQINYGGKFELRKIGQVNLVMSHESLYQTLFDKK